MLISSKAGKQPPRWKITQNFTHHCLSYFYTFSITGCLLRLKFSCSFAFCLNNFGQNMKHDFMLGAGCGGYLASNDKVHHNSLLTCIKLKHLVLTQVHLFASQTCSVSLKLKEKSCKTICRSTFWSSRPVCVKGLKMNTKNN